MVHVGATNFRSGWWGVVGGITSRLRRERQDEVPTTDNTLRDSSKQQKDTAANPSDIDANRLTELILHSPLYHSNEPVGIQSSGLGGLAEPTNFTRSSTDSTEYLDHLTIAEQLKQLRAEMSLLRTSIVSKPDESAVLKDLVEPVHKPDDTL